MGRSLAEKSDSGLLLVLAFSNDSENEDTEEEEWGRARSLQSLPLWRSRSGPSGKGIRHGKPKNQKVTGITHNDTRDGERQNESQWQRPAGLEACFPGRHHTRLEAERKQQETNDAGFDQ